MESHPESSPNSSSNNVNSLSKKPLNEKLLKEAWYVFGIYDRTAIATQRRFLRFRVAILVMGGVSTALAVLLAVWDYSYVQWLLNLMSGHRTEIITGIKHIFYGLTVIAPITVGVLLAASVKLDRGMNWILLRASAEMIKKQIYLYRVGFHDPKDADKFLAQEIQVVSERLMKTQVNRASLVLEQYQSKRQRSNNNPTNSSGIHSTDNYEDQLSALTVEQYLESRLIDQLSWYRRKTVQLDQQWQMLQWSIYVWGGIGTFLAAINAQIWIAITNVVAAGISSFLDFKQFDSTLVCYNQAACSLENVLCWWHALADHEKAESENIKKLISSTEKVIHSATSSWVEEMRDALSELYKTNEKSEPNSSD